MVQIIFLRGYDVVTKVNAVQRRARTVNKDHKTNCRQVALESKRFLPFHPSLILCDKVHMLGVRLSMIGITYENEFQLCQIRIGPNPRLQTALS